MKNLIKISDQKVRTVIGLMSGTSLDGVDAVLLKIKDNGEKTKVEFIDYIEYPFPDGVRKFILKNSSNHASNIEDITILNFLIPHIYFDAIKMLCDKANIDLNEIDLIGTHGQTIQHLPEKKEMFGYEIAATMQIGDPSVLAKLSGIITVGDFRVGDIALGGQGAPLVPYFDFIIFHSEEYNRALLNIGGISNFSILKKDQSIDEVIAFDTGPGNMLIDILMKKFYELNYDEDGKKAFKGKINTDLLKSLIQSDTFIEKAPPKSTGRELYGEEFLAKNLELYKEIANEDWIATVTNFTAYGIYRNYSKYFPELKLDQLIVSGGGAENDFLINSLKEYFGEKIEIIKTDEFGIKSQAKEAICFAVLANETISGNSTNIPKVTGASKKTVLGKICLP